MAALLQQYGSWKVFHVGGQRWDFLNPQRHEVMKAVLLNSADKFRGVHGSPRTALAQNGAWTWEFSPARAWDVSLDPHMGAGHLNGQNALKQYRTGEWEPGVVPNIGWDYSIIGTDWDYKTYIFNRALDAGEFVSATLCWDLRVETINPNPNNHLDGFFDYQDINQVLNDLDLYLMPAGGNPDNPADLIEVSATSDDNVEHIFFPVPYAGFWQIVVAGTPFGIGDFEHYALAWWAGEAISGDFDGDGDVDPDDLMQWHIGFNTSEADADYDGDTDGADFLAWQRNYGSNVPAMPIADQVPEPTAWMLICLGVLILRSSGGNRPCRA